MPAPALVLAFVMALAGCGQRGPLYIPGKPGDPYFDRQNRGAAPASPAAPPSTTAPNGSKPVTAPVPASQPARDSEQKS